jgi:hypothetical protein
LENELALGLENELVLGLENELLWKEHIVNTTEIGIDIHIQLHKSLDQSMTHHHIDPKQLVEAGN